MANKQRTAVKEPTVTAESAMASAPTAEAIEVEPVVAPVLPESAT
jgi:hypothetical protein